MRRALIAAGVVATLTLGGAAAAEAAPKNKACVTVTEFGKVKPGATKARVAKIFGTKGTRESIGPDGHGYTDEVRAYRACGAPNAEVTVIFASGEDLPSVKVGHAHAKSWVEGWSG
ncbi:hypothetical protein KIH74_05925 [Kineosporia sp. J2-2]|uniref:Uncharacterized protein n=1 Tax=Kineosporia corallincola TaxID=2835133 RepID=A0ABS5TBJ7_9ACTN|nr:hypothetical protein [Kineosporia corallincola]MBT0768453.1 hypothetical protein [Kineosporia corallincola]